MRGTDLVTGDFLVTGQKKNCNDNRTSNYVYFAGTLDAAIWGVELAEGNPTQSYRTKQPLKIVAEVVNWERHSPEMINRMIENLRKLSEQGTKAMD